MQPFIGLFISNILHTLKTADVKLAKDVGKTKVETSIPFKLLRVSESLEKNFGWISPENLFDEDNNTTDAFGICKMMGSKKEGVTC